MLASLRFTTTELGYRVTDGCKWRISTHDINERGVIKDGQQVPFSKVLLNQVSTCGVYSWVVKEAGSMVRPLPTSSLTVIENRKSSISMRAFGLIWSPSSVMSSEIWSGRKILLEALTSGD